MAEDGKGNVSPCSARDECSSLSDQRLNARFDTEAESQ